MAEEVFGEIKKASSPLVGHLDQHYHLYTKWYPNYIDAFNTTLKDISVTWKKCNFTKAAKINVPNCFGVYCFTANIGGPFPDTSKVQVLYIGKASDQYLSERYSDYLEEINSVNGRIKVANSLRKYKQSLIFWWCELPSIYVEVVERHMLMCYEPPANDVFPKKDKHWGKAFVLSHDEE